jgi:hypothetical protein
MQKPATARGDCKEDVSRELENCVVSDLRPTASCGPSMTNDADNPPAPGNERHYKWPWFVLAAVLLAIALAVLWMSKEIARTRHIRDLNEPPPATNRSATSPAAFSPAGPERV